jgi:propanol-preferring alcohol dehydrogenase
MVLESHSPIETAPLQWVDVPMPEPADQEIRIKISACGICRTDLHVIEGELPTKILPIIPGHQIIGVVDKVGTGCKRFTVGTRIGIAWLRWTCGQCEFCKTGKENLCPESKYTGYNNHGGYAEYAVVNENYAYEIPKIFSDEEAVPLLCAGIVGYRALQRSLLPNGGTLAIFGFGSSAHMIIQVVLHRSCRVLVVTRGEKHRELARQMGAYWVGEGVDSLPEKVDSAIIFAPVGGILPQALSVLKRGGTVSLAGIHMSEIPKLDYSEHLFYERNVHSVTANTREDGINFLKEASEIPIKPHMRTYPLQDANIALQDLKNDRINGTGVLII